MHSDGCACRFARERAFTPILRIARAGTVLAAIPAAFAILLAATADAGSRPRDTNAAAAAFREALRRDSTNAEARGRLRNIGRQP